MKDIKFNGLRNVLRHLCTRYLKINKDSAGAEDLYRQTAYALLCLPLKARP